MPNPAEIEVVALERKYWQALQDRDIDALLQMTDDPCMVTGAQGVGTLSHQAFKAMMSGATWSLDSFEISDVQSRMLRDDIVVVAYKAVETMTVDGKSLTLAASDASTWIRRNGEWVCALHTEAISGDAFGRDRNGSI